MKTETIKAYPPEKMPHYYTRIKKYFEMKMPHSALAGKAELGSFRSEKGYQLIAASACGRIARDLGGNVHIKNVQTKLFDRGITSPVFFYKNYCN